MKRLFSVLLFSLFALVMYAQEGVKWEQLSLEQAIDKVKSSDETRKMVFVDCYATWCGPCKYMSNVVFPTEEAGYYFNKRFICIKYDIDTETGAAIARKYRVQAVPTFLIFDGDGKLLGRVAGAAELDKFIEKVESAIK